MVTKGDTMIRLLLRLSLFPVKLKLCVSNALHLKETYFHDVKYD
jgi:hypothetical protein